MDESESPFAIDPARLDRELLRQPQMSAAAGRREAQARHEHAQAKARLGVAEARLKAQEARARIAIRAAPTNYGLMEKPTVDDVLAAVAIHDWVQTAQAAVEAATVEVAEALFAVEVAKADVTAYLDRRKSIEGMIELLQLDYWAEREPRTGRAQASADELRRASRHVPE